MTKLNGFTKVELLVVVLISVALIALLYPAVQQARNSMGPGPHGELIPVTAPREENRINHPSGLSIIAPPNWKNRWEMLADNPEINISARRSTRRHDHSEITILGNQSAPDKEELLDYTKLEIQGFPAYEKMVIEQKYSFDDGAWSIYELYIDRDDVWWHVSFSVAKEMTELPPMMREYINTIRFPPKADEENEN